MGNVFSKPRTINEKLFEFEEQILNIEANLIKLRRRGISWKLAMFTMTLIPIFVALGVNYMISIIVGSVLTIFVAIFRIKYKRNCIRMEEYKLKKLKEEQKNFVQNAKEDVNFAKTRRLIEKYETEENRDDYFKTVLNKKQTTGSKISNMILANDPDKMYALICKYCGLHNGLIDPKNDEVGYFYCYGCKQKNKRKMSKKDKIDELSLSGELDDFISKSK